MLLNLLFRQWHASSVLFLGFKLMNASNQSPATCQSHTKYSQVATTHPYRVYNFCVTSSFLTVSQNLLFVSLYTLHIIAVYNKLDSVQNIRCYVEGLTQ